MKPYPITAEQVQAVATRFWTRVNKAGPDDCWVWIGNKNTQRYGMQIINGTKRAAHRISWVLAFGALPDPLLWVLHKCDNPSCVNPAHLFLGTPKDNTRDAMNKNRLHYGERHKSARLSEAQAKKILADAKNRVPQPLIAAEFGICQQHVSDIKRGRRWPQLQRGLV